MIMDSCTVIHNGEAISSPDFIAIMAKEDGDTEMYMNTDAMTMGVGLKLLARTFVEAISECPTEEREEVLDILSGLPAFDMEVADEQD